MRTVAEQELASLISCQLKKDSGADSANIAKMLTEAGWIRKPSEEQVMARLDKLDQYLNYVQKSDVIIALRDLGLVQPVIDEKVEKLAAVLYETFHTYPGDKSEWKDCWHGDKDYWRGIAKDFIDRGVV